MGLFSQTSVAFLQDNIDRCQRRLRRLLDANIGVRFFEFENRWYGLHNVVVHRFVPSSTHLLTLRHSLFVLPVRFVKEDALNLACKDNVREEMCTAKRVLPHFY